MTAYISLSTFVKTTVSAITLLTCYNSASLVVQKSLET
jgi:hypothetical protein